MRIAVETPDHVARSAQSGDRAARLRDISEKLEASFLAEMLKASGAGASRQTFGGGTGEDQFAGFLIREYADAAAKAGGIGLSQSIYEALLRAEGRTE